MANKFVNDSLKQRSKCEENKERIFKVLEDILNQLHNVNCFSKKNELFMLMIGDELRVVHIKRKRAYNCYSPNNLVQKTLEIKDLKQMMRIKTEWLQLKKSRKNY